jgi:hypothetical protein
MGAGTKAKNGTRNLPLALPVLTEEFIPNVSIYLYYYQSHQNRSI